MEPEIKPLKIVDLLAYQEFKLALLYNEFGHKFPESIDLWAKMVVDELEHQKLVRGLDQLVEEGKLYFNAMVLKISNIESHIRSIEKLLDRVKEDDNFTLKEALSTAVNIEQSMLDQNFFTYYSGDSTIINNSLKLLTRDTQEHYNMLLQVAEEEGVDKFGRVQE